MSGQRRHPGFGRQGGWQQADLPVADDAAAWIRGRMPDGWFTEPVEVSVDREEIVIVGRIAEPEVKPAGGKEAAADRPKDAPSEETAEGETTPVDFRKPEEGAEDQTITLSEAIDSAPPADDASSRAERAAAENGRITRFREDTRNARIYISQQVEHRYGRKVSWGAACGGTRQLFTNLSVPVMTRLRQRERQVLDTLVDAGVARSRSEALAWCVKLVGQHTDDWLQGLRGAMAEVDRLRAEGPSV
ncbi:hypothetical protein [Fodinicola acaciae]|uniref:hypothetical protein n=1 Tax=Fodinicola acaciae TaxID=2681555 RepID=UPI0013D0DA5B|nr:hypothetical protein [Fodinicola acaciae]